ncbi:hypothetical protein GM418_05660 [Maribellus comscasis]|uniref:Signal transduction histidine kinase internal region domain-containing protein n=1 Tax=Maribellus comscasis TaxID=2681766 RepID=A0A6I6JLE8_9BACT|nr:histidine kinase [Maribellus comscasis]QGY43161.1 hypothetical protein GM418_05660 [Maribellus comscasis]
MKTKYTILLHLPVWLLAVGLILAKAIFSPNAFAHPAFEIFQLAILVLWILGTFYIFYLYFIPCFLQKSKITAFIILSLIAICIIPFLSFYAIWLNKVAFNQPHNYSFTFTGYIISFIVTGVIGGLGSFYRFAADWFPNLGLKEKMENLQLKSEINLLKSKLNPHFLFNTLNNIDTLIETNSKNASVYLGKLSSILRYIVYDSENEKVSVTKEIDCIKDYVELQKLRFEHDDAVKLTISGVYNSCKIAPALLLPFIENIFKHGTFYSSEDKSKITIHCEGKILKLEAVNPFDKNLSANSQNKGIGLTTTQKRLELLYPKSYILNIKEQGNLFFVNLQINLNDN